MTNSIHNLDTKLFENVSGQFWGIVLGLDIRDPSNVDTFMDEVISQWKKQRMISDPSTQNMTITITGDLTASEFAKTWKDRCATDPVLKFFMDRMALADVLHISQGELLDRDTLLSSASENS